MHDLKSFARNNSGGWLRDLLILFLVLGIPFVQWLGGLPLIDPDEGRYAEIPREMLERADLITPTLNYVKYFEKPPLLYWLNAASLKVFGLNEFAARFPSALCGLATVLATYIIARSLYSRRAALISALILGTSIGFVLQSRIILTDMLLTLCLTGALGSFIIAAQRHGRRSQPLPWYCFYFFCALATLAKGLVGIVFPAGIIVVYLLWSKRWMLLKDMRLTTGLMVFFAVSAPWFVAVSFRNPEFARFFFIHEHFERFTSTVHGRYQPFWFFVPVLLATMLPWSFYIPAAITHAWRNRQRDEGSNGVYLILWTAVIFLFFSKSHSKLIPYILPIFPPLAILISVHLDGLVGNRGDGVKKTSLLLGSVVTVLGCAALGYARLPQIVELLVGLLPSQAVPLQRFVTHAPQVTYSTCLILGGLFLLQGIGVFVTAGRTILWLIIVLSSTSFLLAVGVPHLIIKDIARSESPRELAMAVRDQATADTRIVTFEPQQGISWYLKRRVMVTGKLDELEFGSKQGDQSAWFPDQQQFIALWNSDQHVLALLKKRDLEQLLPLLQPQPSIKLESGRRLLIGNR